MADSQKAQQQPAKTRKTASGNRATLHTSGEIVGKINKEKAKKQTQATINKINRKDKHVSEFFSATDNYKTDCLLNDYGENFASQNATNATMDLNQILKDQDYYYQQQHYQKQSHQQKKIIQQKSPQSLKIEDQQNNEYNTFGNEQEALIDGGDCYYQMQQQFRQQLDQEEYDDEYYDIDQDIKVPAFLNKTTLDNRDKNQFYMTQVINQSRQAPLQANQTNQSHANPQNKGNIQQSRSLIKTKNKKNSISSINRSQVMKNFQKKNKVSPSANSHYRPTNYEQQPFTFNELNNYDSNIKVVKTSKRAALNASALILNSQKDVLNATAPLNMTQINNMYNEDAMTVIGLTDTVNSAQNLNRINNKDIQTQQQNLSSYYGGVLPCPKNNVLNINNITYSSISPNKESLGKINLLARAQSGQDGENQKQNKKYFLNLTLRQLIQQQKKAKGTNIDDQTKDEKLINQLLSSKKGLKTSTKLNKTLDNFKDNYNYNYYNSNQTFDQQNLKTFINNFIHSGNYQLKPNQQQKQQNYKNFSTTMKIKDFNQTQVLDQKINQSNQKQKQKASLTSTQNINFQDDVNSFNGTQINNTNQRKYSALSTYSMNTALPTTSHKNQVNQRKITSTKQGFNEKNSAKSQNQVKGQARRQGSQDKDALEKIINQQYYQDEQKNNANQAQSYSLQTTTVKQNKTSSAKRIYRVNQNQSNNQYSKLKDQNNFNLQQLQQNFLNQKQKTINNSQGKQDRQSMNFVFQDTYKNNNQIKNQTEIKSYEQLHQVPIQRYEQPSAQKYNNQSLEKSKEIQIPKIKAKDFLAYNLYNDYRKSSNDYDIKQNPYATKKSFNLTKKEKKEIQNKTQPIPRQILEMAQAEANNFSTGTSMVCARQFSKESHSKNINKYMIANNQDYDQEDANITTNNYHVQIKPKIGNKKDIDIAKVKEENPSDVYNNKNTVILEEFDNSNGNNENSDDYNSYQNKNQSKLDRYILGKQIGQGAYAIVRVATLKKDNKKFAIKIYDKSKLTDANRQKSVRREIKLLQKMNHQNIVKIYEAFETENHVYLVMDYVGGGSLHSYLKERPNRRLDEEEAKRIFKQILTALNYCHRKSIAHRDIKLENILLDDAKNIKLIDFGFSTCIPNDKKIKMFCGTPSYMAPEIVLKEEYAGPPADIWASGVLLYALMNGCFPFRGATDKELYRKIHKGTYVMHNQNVSEYLLEFLERMINVNADDRPTSEELLQDEWFKIDSNIEIQKEKTNNDEQSINDQKQIFKAKILAKYPVEKTKNTICLIPSNDKSTIKINNNNNISNGSHNINLATLNLNNTQIINSHQRNNLLNIQNNNNNNNNEVSDYGLQQQNVLKKLNQEAYQAYYNTSGANFGMINNNNNALQNPYYNNFFNQHSNLMGQQQNPINLNFYPNINNYQQRLSPNRQQQQQQQQQQQLGNLNIETNNSQFFQQIANQVGTPQVQTDIVINNELGFNNSKDNQHSNMANDFYSDQHIINQAYKQPIDNTNSNNNKNFSPENKNNMTQGANAYYLNAMNNGPQQVQVIEMRGGNIFDQVQMQNQNNNTNNNNQPTYFNIINNITQVTCIPSSQPHQIINNDYNSETNIKSVPNQD